MSKKYYLVPSDKYKNIISNGFEEIELPAEDFSKKDENNVSLKSPHIPLKDDSNTSQATDVPPGTPEEVVYRQYDGAGGKKRVKKWIKNWVPI